MKIVRLVFVCVDKFIMFALLFG